MYVKFYKWLHTDRFAIYRSLVLVLCQLFGRGNDVPNPNMPKATRVEIEILWNIINILKTTRKKVENYFISKPIMFLYVKSFF